MIVKRSWITWKEGKWGQFHQYKYKKIWWNGIFLFGFLPIFVWTSNVEYSE